MLASNIKAIVVNKTVYQHVNKSDLVKQMEIPVSRYDGGLHFNLTSSLLSQLQKFGKAIYFKALGNGKQIVIGDITKNKSLSAQGGDDTGQFLYITSDLKTGDHWFWCKPAYSDTTFASVKLFAVAVIGGGS